MKRGLALITIASVIGMSTPVIYANTTFSATSVSGTAIPASVYIVKSGDTLWKVSQSTGVSIALIEQYNNITNPNALGVGQVLHIPSTWTVKAGDTLWNISQATGVSVANIEQANPSVNANNLTVGSAIIIPSSTTTGTTTYTVKSGDTLWSISQATGVSIANIEQANQNVNPNNLTIGMTLVIPSSSTTTGIKVGSVVLTANGVSS